MCQETFLLIITFRSVFTKTFITTKVKLISQNQSEIILNVSKKYFLIKVELTPCAFVYILFISFGHKLAHL